MTPSAAYHGIDTSLRRGRSSPFARLHDEPLTLVRDPLRMLLFALTILTVSRVHQHYNFIAKARPALLLIVAAVGFAYLQPRHLTRTNVLTLWPMRMVAILGVLACCSTAFGISLGGSASFILNEYGKTLAFCFLMAVSIRHVRDLFTFVWAYVISCGILAFFSLFVFGLSRSGGYVTRLNNLYTYDSNDIGVVLMIGLPLTLLLLFAVRGKRRWLLLLNLVGISATIARSGSRGGFLGFIALGIAALFLVNNVSAARRSVFLTASALALYIGAPPGYWEQMGTILRPKADYNYSSVDGRKAVAERGLGYMAEYPLFGLGISNFPRAECTISPKLAILKTSGPIRCKAPHNSYVQVGAETGVLGLVVWVSIIVGGILAMLRLRRRLPRSWCWGTETERFLYGAPTFFPLALIGFAVTSFFVSFAWMDPLYLMAAFMSGLYVALRRYAETRDDPETVLTSSTSFVHVAPGWRAARSAHRFSAAAAFPVEAE